MFKKLFGKRAAQEKWEAGLVWFRLRYLEPAGPTQCINLLSRPPACGRVALYYRPGETVSQLYLGIPESHVRLLQRMVADFGFSLKPKPPEVTIPAAQRLTVADTLPWDRPFLAHIVNEIAFMGLVGENNKGSYFPQASVPNGTQCCPAWMLPEAVPFGLTLKPAWNGHEPTVQSIAHEGGERRWLLGRSQANQPIQVAGRVNVYGRQEAVAEWLVHQISQMISLNPANLVVIDGRGDVIPQLKRKATVTRLLGEQLAYVDIDSTSLVGGFNPLAAVPDENTECQVQRWQQWFQGMAVHPQGVQLLPQAHQEGVEDMAALRKWLKQKERQGQYTAVSSLSLTLNRLTASRTLREWLEWPTNPYEILPQGSLFFACKATGWDRRQLLRSVLLSALQVAGGYVVVHGFPWQKTDVAYLNKQAEMVISNGPLLPASTVVLTESHTQGVSTLVKRFLADDEWWGENLELLKRGEGLVIGEDDLFFSTWNGRVALSSEPQSLTLGNSS